MSDPQEHQDQELRADCYLFLAGLLSQAPAQEQLDALAHLTAEEAVDGALAKGWKSLSEAARGAEAAVIEDEFFNLFIGLGRGELVPFGSWYITGFLQEHPLADLRDSLRAFGLERVEGNPNTEDHIAQELAVMATLIVNQEKYSLERQQAFFEQHLAPWVERFFSELSKAKSANFYRAIGQLGLAFYAFEKQYLSMPA
ncbi:MAG: TorD/DmsD family molecular chaperone [Granulosicoccaceae bacterium]